MKILLDHCVKFALKTHFPPSAQVKHTFDMGWQDLSNGQLVKAADKEFDYMITVDQNMRHQTSLKGLNLNIVLNTNSNLTPNLVETLHRALPELHDMEPGTYKVVTYPD